MFRVNGKSKAKGFTLIELLVVISIIAVLMSILMPALGRVREQAKTIQCGSNIRQLGIAWRLYASDNDNYFDCALSRFFDHSWFQNKEGVGSYLPTKTDWQNKNVDPREAYKGYYCPGTYTKAMKYGDEHSEDSQYGGGLGTTYSYNTEMGYHRFAKVDKLKNPANKPHMFCFWDDDYLNAAGGTKTPMADYICAAYDGDEYRDDNNGSDPTNYRFTYGAITPHGDLGSNYLFADGHVDRIKPLVKDITDDNREEAQRAYGAKFDWSAKGATKPFPDIRY